MNKIQVTTKAQLDELYKDNAFTLEGFSADEDNLADILNWIKKYTPVKREDFYIIEGKTMNEQYGLTGMNAYPAKNCNLVVMKLADMEEPCALALTRYNIGGRWFNDVVDNNAVREAKKANR